MRWLLIIGVILSICSNVYAEPIKVADLVDILPPMKQGVAFSVPDGTFRPSSTFTLVSKYGASWDVGYIGDDVLMTSLSYRLGNLEGLAEVPVAKYLDIQLGAYYGMERINQLKSGEDWGFNVTLVEVQF